MIFTIELNQTGVGFSATISKGAERITGAECLTIKESLKDVINLAIDCGLVNEKSMVIHMARGNGVVCGICRKKESKNCSFKINYECYESRES